MDRRDPDPQHLVEYFDEIHSIDDVILEDVEEEELAKTPEDGEDEAEWLRQAGFVVLVESENDDFAELLEALTPRQAETVRKRIDTLHATRKRRHQKSKVPDVRDVFSQGQPQKFNRLSSFEQQQPPPVLRREQDPTPISGRKEQRETEHKSGKLDFFLPRHKMGYKLNSRHVVVDSGNKGHNNKGIEVLSYHHRSSMMDTLLNFMDVRDSAYDVHTDKNHKNCFHETEPVLSFQKESSRMEDFHELPDEVIPDRLGVTYIDDVGPEDQKNLKNLAFIELTGLFDTYGLDSPRRKRRKRKPKDNSVFGSNLTALVDQDQQSVPGCNVPLIFQWIVSHLLEKGLREEGLLRVGGSVQKIAAAKEEIEKCYGANRIAGEAIIKSCSVHDAAALMKQFIRNLHEPLLTSLHMDDFLKVPNIPETKKQLTAICYLVLLLPPDHRDTLKMLLMFLGKVAENEAYNRMSLHSIAMLMAPNLFPPRYRKHNGKTEMSTEINVAVRTSRVTFLLIKHRHLVGMVPPDLLDQVRHHKKTKDVKGGKLLNKKQKPETYKPTSKDGITKVPSDSRSILLVAAPQLDFRLVVEVDDHMTAGHVVEQLVQEASESEHDGRPTNHRPRAVSAPAMMKAHKCVFGAKGCSGEEHSLFEVGGNLEHRRLDRSAKVMAVQEVNPDAKWEVRCTRAVSLSRNGPERYPV